MTEGFYLSDDFRRDHSAAKAQKRKSTPEEIMESYDREVEAIQKKQKKHSDRLIVLERKIRELRELA